MDQKQRKYTVRELLFIPIGCAMQLPFIPVAFLLGILTVTSYFSYKTWNFDPIHLWSRSYPDFSLTEDLTGMSDPRGNRWTITYENSPLSSFTGKVRHISPDEEALAPMLSYDILVTSGDYAQPDRVHTVVVNHMFTWRTSENIQPAGSINLLHTVAKDREIFEQLRGIQNGDLVTIKGIEILKIDAFNPTGVYQGYWIDQGCNTLLVTEVIRD